MADTELQKTNVTLSMLLASGILSLNMELICSNPGVRAILNHDGSINVLINKKEKVFQFLSGAARYIEKRSLNGWIYWSVVIDGERQNLGDLRDRYLKLKHAS